MDRSIDVFYRDSIDKQIQRYFLDRQIYRYIDILQIDRQIYIITVNSARLILRNGLTFKQHITNQDGTPNEWSPSSEIYVLNIDRQKDRHTDTQTDWQTDTITNRQIDRQEIKQIGRQTPRQTGNGYYVSLF